MPEITQQQATARADAGSLASFAGRVDQLEARVADAANDRRRRAVPRAKRTGRQAGRGEIERLTTLIEAYRQGLVNAYRYARRPVPDDLTPAPQDRHGLHVVGSRALMLKQRKQSYLNAPWRPGPQQLSGPVATILQMQ